MNYMQILTDKISFNGYVKRSQINRKSENQDVLQEPQELSNYDVGQAILNRNKISFRKIQKPIEVTEKYNKRIEGKDHLDLPNIHVYEYPDANLQVFVNADDKIKATENNELETPKYSIIIENNNYEKHDLLKEKLLCFLLNKNNTNVRNNKNIDEKIRKKREKTKKTE